MPILKNTTHKQNNSLTHTMALLKPIALLGLALATLTSAHFVITLPPPLSDNINNEGSSPCGGSTPSAADNLTDFHVGGDAVSLTTLHPQSFFAFRGQVGTSLAPANWSDVIPTVEQYGLNSFCEPALAVPAAWAGSPGLLQVVQDSEDGVHYQVGLSSVCDVVQLSVRSAYM
jgi:hypothetical protein